MDNKKKKLLLAAGIGIIGAGIIASHLMKKKLYAVQGKVVLVTGGSRGLGLILARKLAAEGAKVAICARTEVDLLTARDELSKINPDILTFTCDLTDRDQIVYMMKAIKEKWGKVNILVNNAGIIQMGPIENMTIQDFEACMKLHFWAPLHCIMEVLPEMIAQQDGRIVNISSIGGKLAVPHLVPYSASKFALTGLSQGLHAELKKYGVFVTTVCPSLMRTGSPRNAYFKGQNKKEYNWFIISDSLPVISISAEKAATQIINALKRGDAELNVGLPAKLASTAQGLAPEIMAEIFSLINKFLPEPGGIGQNAARGYESETRWTKSFLTKSTREAEKRNNER